MSQQPDPRAVPLRTGVPAVDEALAGLDLTGPLPTYPDQLTAALDALQRLLITATGDPDR